jgi:hypothetical protein
MMAVMVSEPKKVFRIKSHMASVMVAAMERDLLVLSPRQIR